MYAVERPCCRDLLSLSPRSADLSPSFLSACSRVPERRGRARRGHLLPLLPLLLPVVVARRSGERDLALMSRAVVEPISTSLVRPGARGARADATNFCSWIRVVVVGRDLADVTSRRASAVLVSRVLPGARATPGASELSPRSYLFSTRACVEYTSHSLNYVASESAANQEVRGLGRSDRGANSFTLMSTYYFMFVTTGGP